MRSNLQIFDDLACRNDTLNYITSNYRSVVTRILSRIIKKTNFLVIYITHFSTAIIIVSILININKSHENTYLIKNI